MGYDSPRSTVELVLERLHRDNCMVCTPEATPNADAFVDELFDLFDPAPPPQPRLLRAMRGRRRLNET